MLIPLPKVNRTTLVLREMDLNSAMGSMVSRPFYQSVCCHLIALGQTLVSSSDGSDNCTEDSDSSDPVLELQHLRDLQRNTFAPRMLPPYLFWGSEFENSDHYLCTSDGRPLVIAILGTLKIAAFVKRDSTPKHVVRVQINPLHALDGGSVHGLLARVAQPVLSLSRNESIDFFRAMYKCTGGDYQVRRQSISVVCSSSQGALSLLCLSSTSMKAI